MTSLQFEPLNEYLDSYYEDLLLESINEGLGFDKLKDIAAKIKNRDKSFKNLVKKFNSSSGKIKRGISALLILLIYLGSYPPSDNFFSNPEKFIPKIDKLSSLPKIDEKITPQDLFSKYLKDKSKIIDRIKSFKTSESVLEKIKEMEGLRLTAYDIKDQMVTIGYGHAEPKGKTRLVPEKTTITKEQAEKLFRDDIAKKERGVKGILLRWNKEGGMPDITQGMFDALVSMAFNMGVNGLENTEFFNDLKRIDLKDPTDLLKAAERIKTTKISSKYPGLEKRREHEHDIFVSDINS